MYRPDHAHHTTRKHNHAEKVEEEILIALSGKCVCRE
jgi:hypothetical protein